MGQSGGGRGGAILAASVALVTVVLAFAPGTAGASDAAWVQRSLALQYELGGALGFRDAPWVGTHNSFNSTAEMGQTLSANDSNQRITIRDQLDQGIRSIELDLHYFPSASAGGFTTVVCHARDSSEGNAGCTVEKTFDEVLTDLAGWLAEHRDQVLLLYLEDDIDTPPGYEDAATILDRHLGPGDLPARADRRRVPGASADAQPRCGPGRREADRRRHRTAAPRRAGAAPSSPGTSAWRPGSTPSRSSPSAAPTSPASNTTRP